MAELSQKQFEQLFFDPVMAARVLMGAKLDHFQAARLRFMWWFPETIDSSGVGTGKTEVTFLYICLRCTLIPNHYAAIYFPTFQIGKDTFWTKFQEFEERHPIFRSQFHHGTRKQDEDKSNQRSPGCWIRTWKNGSKLFMPAPDFKGDSKNQASRDFNTVVIDDYLRAADQGDGMDKQIVDRARRSCYNKNHPLWCNHVKFLGHAESPAHKEYKRYAAALRAIRREGSSLTAVCSFNYLDWSKDLAKKFREDRLIASQKRKLSRDAFRRQYLGIWTMDGEDYYPGATLKLCRRTNVFPVLKRKFEHELFFCGQDTAQPGANRKADLSAWTILRAIELSSAARANFEHNGRYFHLSVPYAVEQRNKDAPQLAAFTHRLNLMFHMTGLGMDPGGGGLWVLPEMRKAKQLIGGVERQVTGLTTPDDPLQTARNPIVRVFKRGSEFDKVTEEFYLRGDEGFLEFWHKQFQGVVHSHGIAFPLPAVQRPDGMVESWPAEARLAQLSLDRMVIQLSNIRQLKRGDGVVLTNRRGYGMFEVSTGKKDLAMSLVYAYARFRLWLEESEFEMNLQDGACFGVSV